MVLKQHSVSERRACRVLNQPRSTQRLRPRRSTYQERLVKRIVELASAYGRYGCRRIIALLKAEGWRLNHKRIERIWQRESLKVPVRQPKRKRLWIADGSCVRLRPLYKHHVEKKWTMPIRQWTMALNQFAILFGDRLPSTDKQWDERSFTQRT